MKKVILRLIMVVGLSLSFNPHINASEANVSNNKATELEVKAMINRLEAIKAMDRSKLSFSEKKELRKEVLSIKEKLSQPPYAGVYVSVGALIIIILLLILLL